jgi:putative SOS response-associated peptidase YedK
MCGRFALFAERVNIARRFNLSEGLSGSPLYPEQPRYNMAPSQAVAAVRSVDQRMSEPRAVLVLEDQLPTSPLPDLLGKIGS